jgi:hypothetical protein
LLRACFIEEKKASFYYSDICLFIYSIRTITTSLLSTLSSQHSPLNALLSTLSSQHSPLNTLLSTLSSQRSPLNALLSTLSSLHSPLNALLSTLSSLHSPLNALLSTLSSLSGAPSVQMHPVPADWSLEGGPTPQEAEDAQPDKKTPALTKEGATKKDNENEFFESDKDQDKNSEKDHEKKKKSRGEGSEENSVKLDGDNNNTILSGSGTSSEAVEEEKGDMEVVDEGVKEVEGTVENKVEKEEDSSKGQAGSEVAR